MSFLRFNIKYSLAIVLMVLCVCFGNNITVSAWIGTGSGGNTTNNNSNNNGDSCSADDNKWRVDCAGVSWGFYKATSITNNEVTFPWASNSNLRVKGATIPAECSKYGNNSGFWHYGVNGFDIGILGGNGGDIATIGSGRWYGHWLTVNPGNSSISWAPYNTKSLNGKTRQRVGAYELEKYGTQSEVLRDYQIAYLYEHPGERAPSSIPGDVWGFCYGDGMIGSTFEGKTAVSGSATETIGYQNTTGTKFVNINDCSATSGCNVTFKHSLKRTQGSGSTSFTVYRSSNYIETNYNKAIENRNSDSANMKSGTFNRNEGDVFSETLTLYPGVVVCERIKFKPNDQRSGMAYTRICVAALGSAETTASMKVKNNSVEKYNNYTTKVYAKPGDVVTYQATYNSTLQYAYRVRPEKMKIDSGSWIDNKKPCSGLISTSSLQGFCQLGGMYNKKKSGGLMNWNNGFTVTGNALLDDRDYLYNNNDDGQKIETNNRNIAASDVGKSLKEQVKTNQNGYTSTTPKKITFSAGGNNNDDKAGVNIRAKVETDAVVSNNAEVLVPYNFNNEVLLNVEDNNGEDIVVDAGETKTFDYEINIKPKPNGETGDTYATIVPEAQIKIRYCFGDGACSEMGPISVEDIRNSYNRDGIGVPRSVKLNVPDLSAGTRFCASASMYPSNSGADTNIDPSGFGGWTEYTDPVCFVVAKKPSFQVWGGSIYTADSLDTPVAEKRYLNQDSDTWQDIINKILAGDNAEAHVFGSWGELSLVANGAVTGFASGAGTGYGVTSDSINHLATPSSVGGSNESDPNYCVRSTLSFANQYCDSHKADGGSRFVGGLGMNSMSSNVSSDKSALISRFADEGSEEYDLVELNDEIGYDINGMIVEKGKTEIISAKNKNSEEVRDITISGNIEYENVNYASLSEIPKLIIYANNININCNVTRIDAVLIAGGDINTCSGITDVNAGGRSNQLIINGVTISNTLTLGRTYGAATGINSIIPAEIINYDSSLFLWANKQSSTTSTGKLTEASRIELAPRY